ncbi:hypothetical protein LF1_37210 [Rubripirellula obstinata]|uniref:Uncharacterized protein n=1 Tax=Rubripirellula obstinata TaxID=406547 RepID=A0A5B1CKV2_9BACT|nr:hypothetical protein LF1_37210 [Rubripirellula obstinata]
MRRFFNVRELMNRNCKSDAKSFRRMLPRVFGSHAFGSHAFGRHAFGRHGFGRHWNRRGPFNGWDHGTGTVKSPIGLIDEGDHSRQTLYQCAEWGQTAEWVGADVIGTAMRVLGRCGSC